MMFRKAFVVAAVLALGTPLAMADGMDAALNQVGISGVVQGVANHLGDTTAGIGVRGSYFVDHILATASYNHTFGSAFAQENAGYTNAMNLRAAYLVPVMPQLAIGPYLGYGFENLGYSHGGNQFSDSGNYLGGGLYSAWSPMPALTVTAFAGYMGSISTHYHIGFEGQTLASGGDGNANLFQTGLNLNYQVAGPLFAYAGFHYDRTEFQSGALNQLKGTFGIGYHF